MIRALLVAVLTFAYILLAGTPFLIYTLLTGNTDRIYKLGISGARLALWLSGVRWKCTGSRKFPSTAPLSLCPITRAIATLRP